MAAQSVRHAFLYYFAAILVKEKVVMVGQRTPFNQIFVFCANGRKFKTIELKHLIPNLPEHNRWACMQFNSDEDLVLVDSMANVWIIDIYNSKIKDQQILQAENREPVQILEGQLQAWQPKGPGKEDAECECDTMVYLSFKHQFFFV
jgi:hypothetical protein